MHGLTVTERHRAARAPANDLSQRRDDDSSSLALPRMIRTTGFTAGGSSQRRVECVAVRGCRPRGKLADICCVSRIPAHFEGVGRRRPRHMSPDDGAPAHDFRRHLLRSAYFLLVLSQSGHFILHASAVHPFPSAACTSPKNAARCCDGGPSARSDTGVKRRINAQSRKRENGLPQLPEIDEKPRF